MERSTRESLIKKSIRWVPELDVPVSEHHRLSFPNRSVWSSEKYPSTDHCVRLHPGQLGQFASIKSNPNWSSGSSSPLEVLDIRPPFESESESTDSSGSGSDLACGVLGDSSNRIIVESNRISRLHQLRIAGRRDPRRYNFLHFYLFMDS
ncbi:hypothetical protein FGIG_00879 [Fasciola gigantica]|uniref:Uncharacterized protein n=1 Tax=Fasciola gigantica TaxID=46835 RepID=A0A504YZE0_FASGI|nr:hypothetical protein FGIG_00879 [Fasciola gigantica]